MDRGCRRKKKQPMMIKVHEDGQRLRALATTYKRMVLLVGLEWLLIATANGQRNAPVTHGVDPAFAMGENAAVVLAGIGVLVVGCVLVVTGYRLAQILGLGTPIVWAIGMFVPLINLIVLLALSRKSQAVCRSHGVRVGLLGPNLDDVARIEQTGRAAGS
jgi:hypothetical protein